jgi:hypothetical protein
MKRLFEKIEDTIKSIVQRSRKKHKDGDVDYLVDIRINRNLSLHIIPILEFGEFVLELYNQDSFQTFKIELCELQNIVEKLQDLTMRYDFNNGD